jgi:hypothetical protein
MIARAVASRALLPGRHAYSDTLVAIGRARRARDSSRTIAGERHSCGREVVRPSAAAVDPEGESPVGVRRDDTRLLR